MIGRIIEEEGQKIVQTLAGATAGTVCKVNYGSDNNYAIPLTLNEAGEGYVGISCACPGPFYNPATGTLTVDNICSTSSNAECADKVLSSSLTGDTVYNLAIWCATSDGNYNSMGFSGGRSITYNPYTATLNVCCGNFTNSLTTNTMYIDNTMAFNATTGTTFEINIGSECEAAGDIDSDGMLSWYCGTCFNSSCITNLTVTHKINGSICKADGTNCYDQYCLATYTADVNLPVLLTNATASSVTAQEGRSTKCPFSFNPGTGVVCACCFCGHFSGAISFDDVYPVGTVYMNACTTLIPFSQGTWITLSNKFLRATTCSSCLRVNGGSDTATLAVCNLPAHCHSITNHCHCGTVACHSHCINIYTCKDGLHCHALRGKCKGYCGIGNVYTMNCSCGVIGGNIYVGDSDFFYCYNSNDSYRVMTSDGCHQHLISGYTCSCQPSFTGGGMCSSVNTGNAGSGCSFSILPSYKYVAMWYRCA